MENPESLETIGRLALRFRMLDREQLEQALAQQIKPGSRQGETLVDLGLLSEAQRAFLVNARSMKVMRNKDIKFGGVAVDLGYVTQQQVDDVLLRQKQAFIQRREKRLIGDILVEEQTITEEQKQSVIEAQQQLLRDKEQALVMEQGGEILTSGDGLELLINKDALKATLRVPLTQPRENLLEHIRNAIEEYNLSYGVVSDEELSAWLDEEEREESLTLARGVEPIAGHGGEVKYYFDTDPLKAGKVKEGDLIDFKDRGELPQVEEGTLLAEISDPDPGVAGTDVHGELIPPPTMKEMKLRCGKGVSMTADGRAIKAEIDGSPCLAATGKISVFPSYKVDGNIGLKTGHVNFDGDIQVSGTVEKDFKVEGGRLSAMEVEAAEINVTGDVVISGGIMGAHIKAGGNVMAAFIHNSVIEADGDVLVQKEIMGSDIKSAGGVYSETCIILDSKIAAKKGIVAADIGSDVSAPSTLMIGSDALLELSIAELSDDIAQQRERQDELRKLIEKGKEENQQIDLDIAEMAQVQDRSQVEMRELNEKKENHVAQGEQEQADELATQIIEMENRAHKAEEDLTALFDRQDALHQEGNSMEQEIEEIEEKLFYREQDLKALEEQLEEEQEEVSIKVKGTLYPMTTIITAHTSVKTKQAMMALEIRERGKRTAAGDEVWKIVTESLKK